ncbi:MAG: aminodeoxychorismate/anthranilate synthase component II [Blautia sp.]|nr:aminodeoxychorismate/anthranilate synthase component II [Blautia sp.]
MILLVDNYDSFSYNLFQLVGSVNPDILVIRNDAYSVREIEAMDPEAIILSPGPGRPENAGICEELIRKMAGRVPILGVCLGHQAICRVFGATVTYASELMHGKQKEILRTGPSRLLDGLDDSFYAARYHSLAADPETIPPELKVIAVSPEGEVMAVEHIAYPVYGVQFHPESVMTPDGKKIIENVIPAAKRLEK